MKRLTRGVIGLSILLVTLGLGFSCRGGEDVASKPTSAAVQPSSTGPISGSPTRPTQVDIEQAKRISRERRTILLPPDSPMLNRGEFLTNLMKVSQNFNSTSSIHLTAGRPTSFDQLSQAEKQVLLDLDPTVGRVGALVRAHFTELAANCREPSFTNLANSLRGVSTLVEQITDPDAFLTNPLTGKPYELTNPNKIPGNIYIKLLTQQEMKDFLQANPNYPMDPPIYSSWTFIRIWGTDRVILETLIGSDISGPCATYPKTG